MSCVPSAALEPGSSRNIPGGGLTSSPLSPPHCGLPPPLHVPHSISVPLVYLAPVMSMQPPSMVRVPLLLTVQFCAPGLPSQAHICTLLPLVPLALFLSTQSALSPPPTIVPVAPLPLEEPP